MFTYTVKLLDRREIAQGTLAFYFGKPPGFQFQAGQYLILGLINSAETDAKGSRRALSIASAPYEPDIMVAMRMRDSAFKRVLRSLPIGSGVSIDGPFGEFNLPADPSQAAVFLAGGIGITPFRSLALDAAHNHSLNPIYLFYSNPRPEDSAFLDELAALERENPNFHFIATMTQVTKSNRPVSGATGYINRAMLDRHLSDLGRPIYYIAGPPEMVKSMRRMLDDAGVKADDIRVEIFGGYGIP